MTAHKILPYIAFLLISLSLNGQDESLGLVLEEMDQKLEFFVTKKKQLKARWTVNETVRSESTLKKKYYKSIFFDETSEIDKLERKYGKRKTYTIPKNISDYESDGIFHSDLKVCYVSHTFDEQDEVFRLHYSVIFNDLKFLNRLYFSGGHEVLNSTISIEVPEWLDLNVLEWNFDNANIAKKTVPKEDAKIYVFNQKNVKAVSLYSNEPGPPKHIPHLIPIARSYKKDGRRTKLLEETGDLYKWYAGLVKKIGNNTTDLKPLVAKITKDAESDLDKIKSIYYWVQDNIRYLAYEYGIMGFKPEACQDVLENRYGDCKGMANLTKEMLLIAGLDARLTWLGTNDIPYDYSMPSLIVDNHMICAVKHDDKMIFLDATEKYTDLNYYAYRIEGKQVMVEDGDSYQLLNIPVTDLDANIEHYINKYKIVDDRLVGSGEVTMSGNRKTWVFNRLHSTATKDRKKSFERYINNRDKNIDLNLTTEVLELERDKDFNASYDLELDNHIMNIGDELYLNVEFDFTLAGRTLPKDRTRPYTLHNRYFINSETEIEIPDAYKCTYLPDPVTLKEDNYDIELSYSLEGNVIHYDKSIKIKNPEIQISDFVKWNETIESVKTFYDDQIILQKK